MTVDGRDGRSEPKPRALVIEAEEHYFLSESTLELLGPIADVHFLLGRGLTAGNRATKDWRVMFPSRADGRDVTLARHRWIFVRALIMSRGVELTYVQTGPDFGPLSKAATFWLFCRLRGRRTVVVLHGIAPYLGGSGRIASRIRARALRHVRGVAFESEALRDAFRARARLKGPRLGVARVRHARSRSGRDQPPLRSNDPDGRVRIGLVGGVTRKRRDFDVLVEALRRLEPAERDRLRLVTLGNCTKQRCLDIVDGMSRWVPVDVIPRHLTEDELLSRGAGCEVLVAPLVGRLGYGSTHGSGAFGDAVRLGRRIIVPSSGDPAGEYSGLTMPYDDAAGLAARLREAIRGAGAPPDDLLDRLTATAVRDRLLADLGLGHDLRPLAP